MQLSNSLQKIPRYLVTTADEQTWKFDQPLVFLGDWCRVYSRKHVWETLDAEVLAPYGLSLREKDADYLEARAIEAQLFSKMVVILNDHFGTPRSERSWRILLGHWLTRYVDCILNRVRVLESCFEQYELSGTTALNIEPDELIAHDSNAAIWAFNDARWNHALYLRIMSHLGMHTIPIEKVESTITESKPLKNKSDRRTYFHEFLRWSYERATKISQALTTNKAGVIINSYLPLKEEAKLHLLLGQAPQLRKYKLQTWTSRVDLKLRQQLSGRLIASIPANATPLVSIVHALFFELLPKIFLEGLPELEDRVEKQKWPKRPRFIFTSNNFDADDLFKYWVTQKIEQGVPYITGQHGNNYGTSRYMNPSVEESTSDRFLTWGWTDQLKQHTPAFILKIAGQRTWNHDPAGGLLLIELSLSHRLCTYDTDSEFSVYFRDQLDFVNALNKKERSQITIRLHPDFDRLGWCETLRWKDAAPDLPLNAGRVPIAKLIGRSRLVIHSYDSTGILECLALNVPMIAFWQNGLDHLRDNAKPFYQMLIDAGIVYLDARSAAAKVSEIYSDVDAWWATENVQNARRKFCSQYAVTTPSPILLLKKLLLDTKL